MNDGTSNGRWSRLGVARAEWALIVVGLLGFGVVSMIACGSDSEDTTSSSTGGSSGSSGTSGSAGSSSGSSGSSGSAGSSGSSSGTSGSGGASGTSGTAGSAGSAGCTADPSTASNTEAVVQAANALLAKLTTEQQSAIQYDVALANARQWSNLPTTFVPRNGVMIGDMSADAQSAAEALVAVAAGNTGATLFSELRAADQYLITNGGANANDYGNGRYYFAFVGTPSTSSTWMLQVAGHHLAYNFSYNAPCTSATPLFDGVEPTSWTDSASHAPLEAQRASIVALLAAISANADAKLSGTFSDLIAGPSGNTGDSKYPSNLSYPTGTSGRGALVSSLTADQQTLVKAVIESWVKNVADPVSSVLLTQYESDAAFAETYVGYSGSADLSTQASYFRVDGPRVWIELTVQGGIVYHNKVHFHTIWRDKIADYGAEYLSQ